MHVKTNNKFGLLGRAQQSVKQSMVITIKYHSRGGFVFF